MPVEIISSGTHAFVVVGRLGGKELLSSTGEWGGNAFVIDVWMQNQSPEGAVEGCTWMTNTEHSVVKFINSNAKRLRIEAKVR